MRKSTNQNQIVKRQNWILNPSIRLSVTKRKAYFRYELLDHQLHDHTGYISRFLYSRLAHFLISSDEFQKLKDKNILIPQIKSQNRMRLPPSRKILKSEIEHFHKNGWVFLPQLYSPRSVRILLKQGDFYRSPYFVSKGDRRVPKRLRSHNDPYSRQVLLNLHKSLQMLVGYPLKPSYSYWIRYLRGARLPKHTDRPQCEITSTLCLQQTSRWAIRLGDAHFYMQPGDLLVYYGQKIPHSRKGPFNSQYCEHLLLHYVNSRYKGPLD